MATEVKANIEINNALTPRLRLRPTPRHPAHESVLRRVHGPALALVEAMFDARIDEIIDGSRERRQSSARQALMVLVRASSRKSLPQIAALFVGQNGDGMDHTSILHGLRRFEEAARRISEGEPDPAFTSSQVEAVVAVSTAHALRRFITRDKPLARAPS